MKHITIKIGLFALLFCNVFFFHPYIHSVQGFDGSLWNFNSTITSQYYYNEDFSYSGSINIFAGGKLHLFNLTMKLTGNVSFYLYSGSELIIEKCNIVSSSNYENSEKMAIRALSGSNLTITESTLNCIGNTGYDSSYQFDSRSIWLGTDIARIEKNRFQNGRNDMCFIAINGNKSGNTIINSNSFSSTTESHSYYSFYIEMCQMPLILFNNTFYEERGYYITSSKNIVINNNSFYYSQSNTWDEGIDAFTCQNLTIANNTFNGYNYGTYLSYVDESLIDNNLYISPSYSIYAYECNYNIFKKNRFIQFGTGNTYEMCSFSAIENCNFSKNEFNITRRFGTEFRPIGFDQYSIDFSNIKIDNQNTVNGKPIKYYEDMRSDLDFGGVELGALYLVNCSQMTIKNVLMGNSYGIEAIANVNHLVFDNVSVFQSISNGLTLPSCANITIKNSRFDQCGYAGISMDGPDYSFIENNQINQNFIGILSDYYNSNVTFLFNTFSNNGNPSINNMNDTFLTGCGLFVRYGYNISVNYNIFHRNWYSGYVLGGMTYDYVVDSKCQYNNFSQYINILEQKYSQTALDNSQNGGCSWIGNSFSDNSIRGQNYKIDGSAQSVDAMQWYTDSDNDNASDVTELAWGSSSSTDQTDSDGISDWIEIFIYRSNPNSSDTDGDLLMDNIEIQIGTNLLLGDTDRDGFSDYIEYIYETNGNDKDSYPGKKQTSVAPSESDFTDPEDLKNIIPGYPMGSIMLILVGMCFILITKRRKQIYLLFGGISNV